MKLERRNCRARKGRLKMAHGLIKLYYINVLHSFNLSIFNIVVSVFFKHLNNLCFVHVLWNL